MTYRRRPAVHTLRSQRSAAIRVFRYSLAWLLVVALVASSSAQQDTATLAQQYGQARDAVSPQPNGLIICEAEEFQVATPGWQAGNWGDNYYAATLANTFLSRKAFLGAPEQCENATASIDIQVASAGRYLVLVRYEAAYRFETQFRVVVQQDDRQLLDRMYGARDNLKIWAFGQKLKREVGWEWGANENVVWEGHDAFVDLRPGRARITLVADQQPTPAARRNVDLVMLTTDVEQVESRIEKESYLPLDGMLTQSGDVYVRAHNGGDELLTVSAHAFGGGTCQQHSPYWIHQRDWQPLEPLQVAPHETTDWVEVGGLLDSLNDGQWGLTVSPPSMARIEIGAVTAAGEIEVINQFEGRLAGLPLAYHADTRYSRKLRHQRDVLFDLLDYLRAQPAGNPPTLTPIFAQTFATGIDAEYDAGVAELQAMFGLSAPEPGSPSNGVGPRGFLELRDIATEKLADYCRDLEGRSDQIAVVSLGDEISLPSPSADMHESFRTWLRQRQLTPRDLNPAWGDDWDQVSYDPDPSRRGTAPGLYYWSRRYAHHYGIQAIKQRTDILREHLPHAGIGANYSPHYPLDHAYLGEVNKWISCFRDEGMTLPWSEDYIWQMPVGSLQMNNINLDMFRAGVRGRPDAKIMYYVMPHWPGNRPPTWRRLFFGAVAHGMTMVNLFEFRPVQAAYTENHVSHNGMYAEILRSFRQLARFEDIVQEGQVRSGQAGLWFSETSDIWSDNHGPFAPAKRALYTAIRHRQLPLDFIIERDAVDGTLDQYAVLYLTDAHVSQAASSRIAQWVADGGRLFATAGAGMLDEYDRPNQAVQELLGVEQVKLTIAPDTQLNYLKQDLPFATAIAQVTWTRDGQQTQQPVFAVRSHVTVHEATVEGTFGDGTAAITRRAVGQGEAIYAGFLPALTYYAAALPLRPVERSSRADSLNHFLPTEFDEEAARLIGAPGRGLVLDVECSQPLVEATIIESEHGVAIPLVNWSSAPVAGLDVRVTIDVPTGAVSLAGGGAVDVERQEGGTTFSLDLDVADALILRP